MASISVEHYGGQDRPHAGKAADVLERSTLSEQAFQKLLA